MLDIRATHYVSPLSEVDFESVPLTVHLANVADETGLITGIFRVYNDSTGLLIHSSDIAPLSLASGAGADVSALTDFDPPAPLDDTYFVVFDGKAVNALVPDGISISLGAFHFDVKPVGMGPAPAAHAPTHVLGGSDLVAIEALATAELDNTLVLAPDGVGGVEFRAETGGGGGAPAAHAASHQNGGTDEISVAGLSGVLADAQTPEAHHGNHEAGGSDVVDHDAVHFTKIHPAADSTTAIRVMKSDNTTVVATFDTTNRIVTARQFSAESGVNSLDWTTGDVCQLYGYSRLRLATRDAAGYITLEPAAYSEKVRVAADGKVGIGTTGATALLDVNSDIIRLRTAKTPASAGAAGNAGDICWDADYLYVCIATNTWRRIQHQTW